MPVSTTPQTTIYETTIEDAALEQQLEERDTLRSKASEARALFQEADDKAKAKIATLDLGNDAPVRVGRFVLTRKMRPARSLSFETEAKVTTKITTIDED